MLPTSTAMQPGSMNTFSPFSRLPAELCAQIWEMTVIPRTVEVRVVYKDDPRPPPAGTYTCWRTVPYLVSPTPVPAILQTCREARYQGLYQQAFSEIESFEPRYVWLVLEIDMVSIGKCDLGHFTPVALLIRRLKLEREITNEYFERSEIKELQDFVNVKEIHVFCVDGLGAWH
ncbi:hypothetical protein GGR58DRAFT_465305 [Xylaria digitata]|nr:hypothetical protein GGR58DRAFT_465305 [Xylaria digitata]